MVPQNCHVSLKPQSKWNSRRWRLAEERGLFFLLTKVLVKTKLNQPKPYQLEPYHKNRVTTLVLYYIFVVVLWVLGT